MKLLILTQKMDEDDPVLGFFHAWVKKLAVVTEVVTVICLERGRTNLPANVRVQSLGKERGQSRLKYALNLCRYLWQNHNGYETVFVHMNQEYVLLAGWWWRLTGKKVTLWRNHPAGSWLTDLAARFCDKIFCTSRYSHTAKYKKTKLMPVGIDTDLFSPDPKVKKIANSILFLGRMAPVKRPDLLLRALDRLNQAGLLFTASFYGDPLPTDRVYYERLRQLIKTQNLETLIRFYPAVPNRETPNIYRRHDIFVNLSPSGMYDKTILEAAACETLPLTSNDNLRGEWSERLWFREGEADNLTYRLTQLLTLPEIVALELRTAVRNYVVEHHSLNSLVSRLSLELKP